jgi:transaldolase
MKFIIDDANIQKIKSIYNYYPVDGVTTNPSFLTKSGRKPYEVLKEKLSLNNNSFSNPPS